MLNSITCSIIIRNVSTGDKKEIAEVLFISVGILCKFAMVPDMYVFISHPLKKKWYILFLRGHMKVHI